MEARLYGEENRFSLTLDPKQLGWLTRQSSDKTGPTWETSPSPRKSWRKSPNSWDYAAEGKAAQEAQECKSQKLQWRHRNRQTLYWTSAKLWVEPVVAERHYSRTSVDVPLRGPEEM